MAPAHPARKSAEYVWLNGSLEPWDQANIHISSVGASGSINVFEGIKAYTGPDQQGLYVFCLREHLRRLAESMTMTRMRCAWSEAALFEATLELLRANRTAEDVYIRPVAFFSGMQHAGFADELDEEPEVLIWTRPFQTRLLTERSLSCQISSWTRITDNQMPPRIKTMSNYQNNRLAALEARVNGYDSAIMLGPDGKVTEGPGACLFVIRDGIVLTPMITGGILESVTRRVVMRLLQDDLGLRVVERAIDRSELYVAEEAFFCGTGAEIQPIGSFDRLPLRCGPFGPITREIDRRYHDLLRGIDSRFAEWRTAVD
jgi:branched-chain amino acid aminotransferase